MLFCRRKQLTSLQRNTMLCFSVGLLIVVGLSMVSRYVMNSGFAGRGITYLLAFVSVVPLVFIILVIARYLSRETDEFIRMLVIQALLCGFGTTMVADTFGGFLAQRGFFEVPLQIFNIDLFCISAMITFRILLWRSR